jgi:hypothetical protein
MTLLFILSILIQIACIVHVIQSGRHIVWVLIIFFFSLLGCLAYFLLEILPELTGNNRTTPGATKRVLKSLEPKSDLKQLAQNLELSNSVENKVNLAKAYVLEGLYDEAIELYQNALSGIYQDDPSILLGLANALFYHQDYAQVKKTLTRLIETHPNFKSQEGHLLFARSLEALQENEAALEEYKVLDTYFSGYEAKCRYALLLQQLGHTEQAQELFKEIMDRAKQLPKNYRKIQKEWIDIASQHVKPD